MESKAVLYRMVTKEHICPFGIKSRYLLRRNNYQVEDHLLESRKAADAFKETAQVKTTPQTWINGERIGGYDDLRAWFGLRPAEPEGTTYRPVVAIFATALLMALAIAYSMTGNMFGTRTILTFIAISMCILAIQKLQDLESFTTQFVTYDLLSMRVVPYAYIYPFLEVWSGIGMLGGLPALAFAPVSIFIGAEGAFSVFKAVYVDKRELKCACAGGNSKVPLGFVSLTENLFMITGGLWMLLA